MDGVVKRHLPCFKGDKWNDHVTQNCVEHKDSKFLFPKGDTEKCLEIDLSTCYATKLGDSV